MRICRRFAAILALSTSAVLFAAVSAGPAAAERAAKTCESSALVVWIPNGQGNGTAGSVYYEVELQNSGSKTCTLKGYPTVTAVDLAGKPLSKPAKAEGGAGNGVTLAPGASASFNLRITEAGNYSASQCHPTNAQGVSVRAPGTTAAKFVPLPFEACRTQGLLGASSIHKG